MDDQLTQITKHEATVPTLTGLAGLALGLIGGYFIAKRRLREVIEVDPQLRFDFDIAAEDIQDLKNEQKNEELTTPYLTLAPDHPEDVRLVPSEDGETIIVKPDADPAKKIDYGAQFIAQRLERAMTSPTIEEPETHNVFAGDTPEWSYEEEVKSRRSDRPYVLHQDEYFSNEEGLDQLTLTYFSGDDIMADAGDTPVFNYTDVVGELKFGHGSEDPNVFFVRNEKNGAEYEIIRHPGRFEVEVMGLDIPDNDRAKEIKHSNHLHKFPKDE